tara:strand:- start:78 stop:470 length:393 start_codon:yes stop_codon:yes gene_type:complete
MPYDKEGKYYRIPKNSNNSINKSNIDKKFTKSKNNSTTYGTLSLVLSLATVLISIISILGLVVFPDEESKAFLIFAFILCFAIFTSLISLGAGILGIFKDFGNRTRAFIGTIVSTAFLVTIIGLMIFGST